MEVGYNPVSPMNLMPGIRQPNSLLSHRNLQQLLEIFFIIVTAERLDSDRGTAITLLIETNAIVTAETKKSLNQFLSSD